MAMNSSRPILAMLLAAMTSLAACSSESEKKLQGWIEADLVFVGPDEAGRVETLSVREGDPAEAGAPLFTMDADLQRADVMQIEASVTNATQNLERATTLLNTNAGTQKNFEDAQATLRTAQARLNSAQTRLVRRRIASPAAGVVQQVYYRPGEVVPAGRPVVAILPPGNIKVRFYAAETMLPRIAVGNVVRIACDGCAPELTARISFIARSAEYTPPVIYSQEERAKLVFLIEARPDKPDNLRVGQPVSVTLVEGLR
jgi:HlyD family secretion protein